MRVATWRADMHKVIDEKMRRPYEPGKHDCALFFADIAKAITGTDPAKGLRGKYKTLARGLVLLKKKGFNDHVEMIASLYPEIHPSMAAVGDAVVFKVDDEIGYALGVVISDRAMVLRPEGMGTVGVLTAIRAFRIE